MLIFAHRGASSDCPENTLSSFKEALVQGADGIELDVRLSKDGIPVVCHDAKIQRTSNSKGYIHQYDVSELKTYDFGSWFSHCFVNERIPTLEEVMRQLKHQNVLLNIELKNGPVITEHLEAEVLKLVYKYDFKDRIIISSFDHISLKKLKQLDNEVKVAFIFHLNLIHLFDYIDHSGLKPYSIHPNHFYVSPSMIAEAHRRNIKVFPYTVDDMELGEYYRKLGVDGIITNKPKNFKGSSIISTNQS